MKLFVGGAGLAVALAVPTMALAQQAGSLSSTRAIGEEYRIELSGGLWDPTVFGVIASEQFGIAGTEINLVDDLGFGKIRFRDGRLVLRPGKKHKFRVQYTPISYSADATLARDLVFNGILFPVEVPIQSTLDWKVWRFGYEFDFIYTDRGFLGILIEGRYTEMNASLKSALGDEFSSAKLPLPSFGLVARVYPIRNLSITAEASGFKLPNFDERYAANYLDVDVYGTFNVTHHLGVQAGWRRITTDLKFENDTGDLKFDGLWFGGAVRF
ncbi:MAG: hypothetical protein HQ485_01325 [Acidobacteria bacterium]|nr:hypothetical protein [Acidobacteriota bacterium]